MTPSGAASACSTSSQARATASSRGRGVLVHEGDAGTFHLEAVVADEDGREGHASAEIVDGTAADDREQVTRRGYQTVQSGGRIGRDGGILRVGDERRERAVVIEGNECLFGRGELGENTIDIIQQGLGLDGLHIAAAAHPSATAEARSSTLKRLRITLEPHS
jgi:hypothetical protein